MTVEKTLSFAEAEEVIFVLREHLKHMDKGQPDDTLRLTRLRTAMDALKVANVIRIEETLG